MKNTKGFLAEPKEVGRYPAVIVIHEIWGLVDQIKDVASRLAREGYVALPLICLRRRLFRNWKKAESCVRSSPRRRYSVT